MNERRASLHGLGFAQVKLTDDLRLNVWHPLFPTRRNSFASAIHDHRFGFVSEVLVGSLYNTVWSARPTAALATHECYSHDGDRLPTGNRPWTLLPGQVVAEVVYAASKCVSTGESYRMEPYVFHSTSVMAASGVVVTLMRKTEVRSGRGAITLNRLGFEPDPDFDRFQMTEDEIMATVALALAGKVS